MGKNIRRDNIEDYWDLSKYDPDDTAAKLMTAAYDAGMRDIVMENVKTNLMFCQKHGVHGVSELLGTWHDKDLLVVGAGPSATQDEITRLSKGRMVVAVDNALKRCEGAHYVVCMDAQPIIAEFIEDITPHQIAVVWIGCDPSVFERAYNNGARIYAYIAVNADSALMCEIRDMAPKYMDGLRAFCVVGAMAVELAYWMGAKSITCIGNELSWGSLGHVSPGYVETGGVYPVEDFDGYTVFTIKAFEYAALHLNDYAQMYHEVEWRDESEGLLRWNEIQKKRNEASKIINV